LLIGATLAPLLDPLLVHDLYGIAHRGRPARGRRDRRDRARRP
jgi:hypothetical protein